MPGGVCVQCGAVRGGTQARNRPQPYVYTILGSDQQQYGPVDEAAVIQWIQSGQANAATMIHKEGTTEWAAVATFPEFAAALSAAPPPVATAPASTPTQTPKVFGILNILFGILCGICQGIGTAALIALLAAVEAGKIGSEAKPMLIFGVVLSGVAIILLLIQLISGVGLLMAKKWGRTLAMVYAIGYLLVSIAESIMEFALMPDAIGNVSGST